MQSIENRPAATEPGVRGRLDSLTGLRFLAAFVVFGLHLIVLYPIAKATHMTRFVVQGGVGVSFFFVLSGFVLTWSYRNGDTPRAFFRRRVARIVPNHVVAWAATWLILAVLVTRATAGQAIAQLLFIGVWIPKVHLIESVNVPSWSLGCEMFFYALFPFVIPLLARGTSTQRRMVMAGLVGCIAIAAVATAPATYGTTRYWAVYFLPLARLPEFLIGMLLAFEVSAGTWPKLRVGPVAALTVGAYVACGWIAWPYSTVLVTVVPFALLIAAAAQQDAASERTSSLSRLLASKPLVLLGTWSFAFYLLQWPVMVTIGHFLPKKIGLAGAVALSVGTLIVIVAASALLHTVIEAPMERLIRRPGLLDRLASAGPRPVWRRPAMYFAACATAVVVALAAGLAVHSPRSTTISTAQDVVNGKATAGKTSAGNQKAGGGARPNGAATGSATGSPSAGSPSAGSPSASGNGAGRQTSSGSGTQPGQSGNTLPGGLPLPSIPPGMASCSVGNIGVTISTDSTKYSGSQPVQIMLTATNKSALSCTLSPANCYPLVMVDATTGTVVWEQKGVGGTRTGTGCPVLQPFALAAGHAKSVHALWVPQPGCVVIPAGPICAGSTLPATPSHFVVKGAWFPGVDTTASSPISVA